MGNARHVRKLRQGAAAWNAWRAAHPGVVPDLRGLRLPVGRRQFGPSQGGPIDLRGADLRGAVLAGADLARACMVNADLTGADLRGASLAQADLDGALLDGANLSGAWLGGARNLAQAQIERAAGQQATVLPTNLEMPRAWLGEPSPNSVAGAVVSQSRGEAAGAADGDAYAILGVARTASPREIRAAYLSLVKRLHPDGRARGPAAGDSDEGLKRINDAYREIRAQRQRGRDGEGARRWASARRAATVFMAGLVTSAAPVLVALLIGFYWVGWFGPSQDARARAAALRQGTRDTGPVETGAIPEHRGHTETGRQIALGIAESLGTKEAWERPAAAYPDGETAERARAAIAAIERLEQQRRAEADAWAAAEKSGDREALARFVAAYPDSANAALARETLAALDRAEERRRAEADAWAAAEKSGDREALARFVAAYPDGENAARAREILAAPDARRAADLAAWAAAEKDGAGAAFHRYLADHPEGAFAADARRRLAALEAEKRQKDDAAWVAAVQRNSKSAYAAYLAAHPDGRHAPEARVRMAEPERVATDTRPEPVKGSAGRPPPRQAVPDHRWSAADEPFVGADGRIRR